jgi:hypothetical protein
MADSSIPQIDPKGGGEAWQPIETAPKQIVVEYSDIRRYGAHILLWTGGEVVLGRWWQALNGSCNFIADGGRAVRPTLWQPLPAPPKEQP